MSRGRNIVYSREFKEEAVRLYLEESSGGYKKLTKRLGLKSKTQLRDWVARVKRGEPLDDERRKSNGSRKGGRPRTKFNSLEEKLAYVEAELEYVKKLYRSLFRHEWGAHKKHISLK